MCSSAAASTRSCNGVEAALEQLDWQVNELGARSIKFYNGHVERSWSCDDRELAYPLYERCLELGVDVIQFHKGIPFGLMDLEAMRPNDLQRPARDFPELKFVIHHLALPYFDEAVWIAARFPNIYLSLASNLNFTLIAPRAVQKQLGQLLQMVGSEKLCYASDAALSGGPAPYLRAFMDLEIPDDLRDGYGYPQITHRDRAEHPGLDLRAPDGDRRRTESAGTGGNMNPLPDVALRIDELGVVLGAHAGGIELVEIVGGVARVRYTGMCTGCPLRPLTTASTVRPALLELDGIESVEVEGSRISAEAEARLVAAFRKSGSRCGL